MLCLDKERESIDLLLEDGTDHSLRVQVYGLHAE